MKIVFLGTPEFAVPSLDILVSNGYEVAAVVTAPGKKAGRGLQLKESAVWNYAHLHKLKILQPEKLSDPDFINTLKELDADLFVVVAFRMLPEKVWQMPQLGTFNLHSSLLPQYRGAAPINRAIMNGETETGVTTFFLKHEIDTGNIILQEKLEIFPDETAGELHDRLKDKGANLVLETVQAIEKGNVAMIGQEQLVSDNKVLKSAPKIFNSDCIIHWDQPAQQIHNQVRGLSPFPGAYTLLKDAEGNKTTLKIYKTKLTTLPTDQTPGTITVGKRNMYIHCQDFLLELLLIQSEGKKRIFAHEFIAGFRMEKGYIAISEN